MMAAAFAAAAADDAGGAAGGWTAAGAGVVDDGAVDTTSGLATPLVPARAGGGGVKTGSCRGAIVFDAIVRSAGGLADRTAVDDGSERSGTAGDGAGFPDGPGAAGGLLPATGGAAGFLVVAAELTGFAAGAGALACFVASTGGLAGFGISTGRLGGFATIAAGSSSFSPSIETGKSTGVRSRAINGAASVSMLTPDGGGGPASATTGSTIRSLTQFNVATVNVAP